MVFDNKPMTREVELNLTEDECFKLSQYAIDAGTTVSELIEDFIGDLTGGYHTGGSDERECAAKWYSRRDYTYTRPYTFLVYLKQNGILDTAMDEYVALIQNSNELNAEGDEDCRREIQKILDKHEGFFREAVADFKMKDKAEPVEINDALHELRNYMEELELLLFYRTDSSKQIQHAYFFGAYEEV